MSGVRSEGTSEGRAAPAGRDPSRSTSMSITAAVVVPAAPALLPGIGKPPRVPADATAPETRYRLDGVRVDSTALQAYCHATGQRFGGTYPGRRAGERRVAWAEDRA